MNLDKYPLVSMCIPVYNHEKYIKAAIESAINQDYQNLELIMINDGSTDNTDRIIKSMEDLCIKRFKNYLYISRENKGVSYTMNQMLGLANGEYYTGMASDDIQETHRVSTFVNFLMQNKKISCAFSSYNQIDNVGNLIRTVVSQNNIIEFNDVIFGLYNASFLSFIFRRKDLIDIGGFIENVQMEDWELALRCTFNNINMYYLNDVLYNHRLHENNTHKIDNGMQTERLKILSKYENFKDYKKAYFHWKILRYNKQDKETVNEFKEWLYYKLDKFNGKKYLIYGAGTFGNIIKNLIGEKFIGFIDQYSINFEDNYDYIIISVLGREDTIVTFLKDNFDIKEDKIIVL